MTRLNEYMTIKEAAEYLGVALNYLRNWGREGKIHELRHTVNNYRLYQRQDLDTLLDGLQPITTPNPVRPSRGKAK